MYGYGKFEPLEVEKKTVTYMLTSILKQIAHLSSEPLGLVSFCSAIMSVTIDYTVSKTDICGTKGKHNLSNFLTLCKYLQVERI